LHLYVDTDILVDVVLKRIDNKGTPLWVSSTLLLDEIYKGKHEGSASILSFYILSVLLNPKDSKSQDLVVREEIRGFTEFLKIADLTKDILEQSLNEKRLTFEDAVQFKTAKKTGAEALVTRNLHHLSRVKDEVEVLLPEEIVTLQSLKCMGPTERNVTAS